jgi:HK97 gp10 family phage protein
MSQIVINLDRFAEVMRDSPELVDKAVRAAAQEGRNRAVLSIQERSSGETQHRYNPDRYVVAAAPGETPNTDTGNLVNSIQVEQAGPLTQAIIAGAEYATALELGTADMEARPFMTPMALSLEQDIAAIFKAVLGDL